MNGAEATSGSTVNVFVMVEAARYAEVAAELASIEQTPTCWIMTRPFAKTVHALFVVMVALRD
jgi:hypothetical protein